MGEKKSGRGPHRRVWERRIKEDYTLRTFITKNNQMISNNDLKVMFDDITTNRIAEIDSLEQQEWLKFAGELQNMLWKGQNRETLC